MKPEHDIAEPQLEIVQNEREASPHEKLMAAYERLNRKVDQLIETKRTRRKADSD